jgi:hypothetical protein
LKAVPLFWAEDNISLNYCGNEKEEKDSRNKTKQLHKAKFN